MDTRMHQKRETLLGFHVVSRPAKVMSEVTMFRMQEGWSAGEDAAGYADMMLPYRWWFMLGAPAGELRSIAIALLAGNSAQSGSERNWNVYEKLHCEERNRLGVEKIEKLVSIYGNERIANKVTALDYTEETLELTLETRAIKAREAAAKDDEDGATGDIALHLPPAAA